MAQGEATTVYRQAGWAVARVLVPIAAVVAVYYWLPLDHSSTQVAVTILVIGLVLLIALIAWQVRLIIGNPHPGVRAVEALATTIPLFVVLFARRSRERAHGLGQISGVSSPVRCVGGG